VTALPRRPRPHVLEAESRQALEHLLPADWIVRAENPDYGADLSVEIVRNGQVTGKRFFVQLKATDEADIARALQVKVKQKAFRYLQNLNGPALLVLYHASSRRLFGRWVHDLDVFYAGRSASHFTFRLVDSDALIPADMTPHIIDVMEDWEWINSPTLHGPLTLELTFHSSQARGALATDIARELRMLAEPLAHTVKIREAPLPGQKLRGRIDVTSDDVVVRFTGGGGSGLHRSLADARRRDFRRKRRTKQQKPQKGAEHNASPLEIAADILATLALALGHAGHQALAADVAELAFASATITHKFPVPALLLQLLLEQRRHVAIVRAAGTLVRNGHPELADSVLGAVFVSEPPFDESDALLNALEEWLAALAPIYPAESLATAEYNLARYVGRLGWKERRGVSGYIRASRLNPHYRTRGYFWNELGAMFFHLERFLWSARAYHHAAALGEDARAQEADALWRTGRYEEAREAIELYVGDDEHWLALRLVLPNLIRLAGTGHQQRDPTAAAAHVERGVAAAPADAATAEQAFEAAIAADAMAGLAWFNLGQTLAKADNLLDAAVAFLTTGLIQLWDVEAWAHAIAAAANAARKSKDDEQTATSLMYLALAPAVHHHREALFGHLVTLIGPDQPETRPYVRELLAVVPPRVEVAPVIRITIADRTIVVPADDAQGALEKLLGNQG
jgi:tetratricopeptide (TPR) repeat protein